MGLIVAMVVLTGLGLVAAAMSACVGVRLPTWGRATAVAMTVAVQAVWATGVNDALWLAKWIPVADAVVWTNLAVVWCGVVAGLVWGGTRVPDAAVSAGGGAAEVSVSGAGDGRREKTGIDAWRRHGLAAVVFVVGFVVTGWPVLGLGGRPELAAPRVEKGVVLQSSQASCSAAAVATLLLAHGIEADEAEMARLCLTTARGTYSLGRYRGLVIKTRGTSWRVRVFTGSYEEFKVARGGLGAGPGGKAIVSVGLRPRHGLDAETLERFRSWGWRPGLRHTVALLGLDDRGEIEVGDPTTGRERWTEQTLRDLWYGEALWLERE